MRLELDGAFLSVQSNQAEKATLSLSVTRLCPLLFVGDNLSPISKTAACLLSLLLTNIALFALASEKSRRNAG